MTMKRRDKRAAVESARGNRVIDVIERIGNKFPSPFFLFIILSVMVLIVAELMKGMTFSFPGSDEELEIVSLFNRSGFVYMISSLLDNFINFSLIPLIVVFSLAIGVGEYAGLYRVVITRFFRNIPDSLLYFIFLLVSINGNIISDASLIILPTIGAQLFISKGKNPVVAIMTCYAGYLAGLSANLVIAGTDVICSGITESALSYLPITADLSIHPACNWYFFAASAVLLSITGTFAVKKFVEPKANRDLSISWDAKMEVDFSQKGFIMTKEEHRGLRFAFYTTVIYFLLVGIMLLPGGWLRDSATDAILPSSPLIDNIAVIFAVYFFAVGLMYGIGASTIKSSHDVAKGMSSGLSVILELLVVFFFAAQFSEYIGQTNLASYIAVKGAEWLESMNYTGFPMLLCVIIFTAVLNFFIGTVGAKWSVMAPILVPMLALLGYHPAMSQCIYRIGDAITNTINPISVYVAMMLVYMRKYKPNSGVGTVVTYQIPFCITFTVTWVVQIFIWYVLNLPLGPASPIYLS